MKTLRTASAIFLLSIPQLALAGGATGGPWASGAYYPGYLNGKYMGVVTGNNISGVLGFALVDGAPPFRSPADTAPTAGFATVKMSEYGSPRFDITQNYFAIFVEGRTYVGLTAAGIDIEAGTVAGALQGTDPIGVPAAVTGAPGPGEFADGSPVVTVTTTVTTNTNTGVITSNTVVATNFANPPFRNALSILNRGLSGGFTAKIKSKGAVFTFKGDGQLSTPANRQSYTASGYVQQKLPLDPPPGVPTGLLTNLYVTGIYDTEFTHFKVRGIRTSLSSFNLQENIDRNSATTGGGAAGGGGGGAAQ